MKCFELKFKRRGRLSDPIFMAKLPIMSNKYLIEKLDKDIGLLKKDDNEDTLMLVSENNLFIEQYSNYYKERFEMTEMPSDFIMPYEYKVIFGKVKFDNENEAEAANVKVEE